MPENVEKIFMRHPHTGDIQEVEATSEALTPWMVKGYQKYDLPAEIKGVESHGS